MRYPTQILSTAFGVHSSVLQVADQYKGLILDQFGVLHNGVEPLPGAIDAVKELCLRKKKLIILSNTSSPAKSALKKLEKLGFDMDWFEGGAVTSGEEASAFIRAKYGSDPSRPNKAVWLTYAGSERTPPPLDFIRQCGTIELASSIDEADFVIAHGSEIWYKDDGSSHVSLNPFMQDAGFQALGPILSACYERKLPLVCANPDFIVRMADESIAHMPGKIGRFYEDLGGDVTYFGKPHPQHFQTCLSKLNLNASEVAHVGDSLDHDVAGALGANIDCIFVTSGIHCDELNSAYGELPSRQELEQLFGEYNISPTHVIASFSS
jgi:HAD superfamily hydrolase (TIGR01459 family)